MASQNAADKAELEGRVGHEEVTLNSPPFKSFKLFKFTPSPLLPLPVLRDLRVQLFLFTIPHSRLPTPLFMRALRIISGTLTLDPKAAEPAPGPGEVLVRPVVAGISATDRHIAAGRIASGAIMGSEFVGVVDAASPKLPGARVVASPVITCGVCDLCKGGLPNHCRARRVMGTHARDGCFADRACVPLLNMLEVPRSIDDESAVFAWPLACVAHIRNLLPATRKSSYITILGDGVTGLLAAQVLASTNDFVRLLGKHPDKFGLCEKWGVKHRHVDEPGRRQDQDVVIDCTGAPGGLALAMQMARPRATILTLSTPSTAPGASGGSGVDLSPTVVNELTIQGVRGGRLAEGLELLAQRRVDVLSLITARYPLAQARDAISRSASGLKVLLTFA